MQRNPKPPSRMSVVVAVLAVILVLVFVGPSVGRKNRCIENLHAIQGAKNAFARQFQLSSDSVAEIKLLQERGFLKSDLQCPSGGKYIVGKIGEPARCTVTNRMVCVHALWQ